MAAQTRGLDEAWMAVPAEAHPEVTREARLEMV